MRQVRERFERFRSDLSTLPARVTAPELWIDIAKSEATKILLQIAKPEHRYLIPQFVDTVTVLSFGTPNGAGMTWTIERVSELAIKLSELTEEQREDIWNRRSELIDRLTVEEWVAQAKVKSDVDAGLNNQQIAERILGILFGPPDPDRRTAAESLLFGTDFSHQQHLLEFHAAFLNDLVSSNEVSNWLKAVAQAWRMLILEQLPEKIRQGVRDIWRLTKV